MQVNWTIDEEGILTIEGNGRLPDFGGSGAPDLFWRNSCDSVRKVVIGDGITEIGTRSFENCVNLIEAVLPSSLTRIRAYAFRNCTALQKIDAGSREFRYVYDKSAGEEDGSLPIIFGVESFSGTPWAKDYFGGFYCREDILYICFEEQEEIRIPEGIRRISGFAFTGVKAWKLFLPETLEKIEDHAFIGARFFKIVMPVWMEVFATNCVNGELRDSLCIPKRVRKNGSVKVPDLYELVPRVRKKFEPYGKLVIHEKSATLDEKGVRRGVWGREQIDVGASLLRRLKRGGALIGIRYKENRVDTIQTFLLDSDDKVIEEYLAHPYLDGNEVAFKDSYCFACENGDFQDEFRDKDAKELIRRGVLRILPDETLEEWYWNPLPAYYSRSGWDIDREFLGILVEADPGSLFVI